MSPDLVKICPTCKAEYVPTVERCPACDGELVATLVREEEDPYRALTERDGRAARLAEGEPAVSVATSNLDWVSGLAVELAADGIPYRVETYVPPEEPEGEDEMLSQAPKANLYQLLIHPRDTERARAAYERYQRQENPEQLPDLGEDLTECPACFGPLVSFELGKRCPECELEFHELPEEG